MAMNKNVLYGLIGIASFLFLKTATKIKTMTNVTALDYQLSFLRKMKPIAEQIYKTRGIKTVITISQSALESNWGQSRLAKEANNLFGMTAPASWIDSGRQTTIAEKGRPFKMYYN